MDDSVTKPLSKSTHVLYCLMQEHEGPHTGPGCSCQALSTILNMERMTYVTKVASKKSYPAHGYPAAIHELRPCDKVRAQLTICLLNYAGAGRAHRCAHAASQAAYDRFSPA